MTSDVVIRAEGLGKKYIIGHEAERERYTTLRDSVGRSLKNWGRSARDMFSGKALVAGDETEEFWALKDINFEIKRGDVVGIIGRNGAGKSTLLKVLSRITEPTTGRVTIDGRVASLLEVGTGFHPELSGRENIYLNGAILGMSREEIKRKFDEIVDFAGVEKFLDTPVKRYSSGMYVRLAFAVAAHLEPEILIVDEVLAVGDAEFQKKCLGKMKDVAGHGRTVLFVSHNMAAVQLLCDRVLHLGAGTIAQQGPTGAVISQYLSVPNSNSTARNGEIEISPISYIFYHDDDSEIRFMLNINMIKQRTLRDLSLLIYTTDGLRLGICDLRKSLRLPRTLLHGIHQVSFIIPRNKLIAGSYSLGLYISTEIESFDLFDHSVLLIEKENITFATYPLASRGHIDFAASEAKLALLSNCIENPDSQAINMSE
jgi:ABC-type polysaccharide/polyol phosphate transport system ATPase subunit